MKLVTTRALLAINLALGSLVAGAAPLKEYLPGLPAYFTKPYAALELYRAKGTGKGPLRLQLIVTKSSGNGKTPSVGVTRPSHLVVDGERKGNFTRRELGAAFLQLMANSGGNFSAHVSALDKLGFRDTQNAVFREVPLWQQIKDHGGAILAGEKTSDKGIAALWWQLKFSGANQEIARQPKKGDPVLLAIRQYGYFQKSGSITTNLRRRLDFGHAALGIRYLGEDANRDLYINPGSKDLGLNETALPNKLNPEVMNAVAVTPLWQWADDQIYGRYMEITVRALALNTIQKKALQVLVPRVRGIHFGPAIVIKNDCVDGASRLLNFLLPINRVVDAQIIGKLGTPKAYLNSAAKQYPDLLGEAFEFSNIKDQNPHGYTPSSGFEQKLCNLNHARTFREWRAFESETF